MQVIGIDIGGTSIKGIVTDESGSLLASCKLPTDASRGQTAILETVNQAIVQLRNEFQAVQAIGIGSAGRINVHTGEVVFATDNLPGWQGTPLADILSTQYQLPVVVDNDANTALLGEAWLGAGQGFDNIIMITLGTGVGGANLIDGKLVRGKNWNGGEWGHVVLVPGGTPCNCGRIGCVEQYLSGNSLTRIASEHVGKAYKDGLEFMQDVYEGNSAANEVMDRYVEQLAIFLGNLQLGIDPDAFIVGGGVIDSSENWWYRLEQHIDKLRNNGTELSVLPAKLSNDAGCFGAAKLALQCIASNN